ncbi:hypothetical protein AGLY_016916 [Aphis glycines]|uniref:DDE Tnp4 domain-containing protein n=1 Tax=Aphis glycines TaxID=307491 RepID=A0A6G0SXK9_APHGL|nr:hypothetical protein AGLY_016916 [Aphis glycines]
MPVVGMPAGMVAGSNALKNAACSITTVLCDELLEICEEESKKRKRKVWVRNWMDKKKCGASETIIRELRDNDPLKFNRADTFMRPALSARLKLELTLAFLASGTNSRILSVMFRDSKASISNMIPEVCDAIYSVLNDYIKVPNLKEWEEIQFGFNEKWNFPGCCGAIDGKHVVIKAPPSSGSEYYNYKGTNSIVLLGVVDHNYCFRYIDVGSYERNADAGVFQLSDLYPLLESDSLLPKGGVLVGDDAFPLKTYLMKPYLKVNLTKEEKIYNYRTSRA